MMRLTYIFILLTIKIFAQQEFKYQNYKPIEDFRLENFAKQILQDAQDIYGKPAYPVKEVYFFQSKLIEKPYLLSIADVYDWQEFIATIQNNPNSKINRYLYTHCSFLGKKSFSFKERVNVIRNLNNLIDNKSFFNETDLDNLTSKQRGLAGKGFWGLFNKNIKHLNRSLITTSFKKSIHKYYASNHYGEGLQQCQAIDLDKGIYAIFLRNLPQDGGVFYTELCHEIFHLLNARLFDWYAEGFATTFSKKLSKKYNFSWKSWEDKFKKEVNNPYSLSYRLCTELDNLNNKEVNTIFQFIRLWDKKNNRHCIYQEGWLKTLSLESYQKTTTIIKKYRQKIKKNQGRINYFN